MPTRPRYQNDAWWAILEYLDHRVDPVTRSYQVPIERLVEAAGVDERSLYRYLDEMKHLRVLDVRREATDFVAGRQPSTYTLLIRPVPLRERWAEYLAHGGKPEPLNHDAPTPIVGPTPIEAEIDQAVLDALEDLDEADGEIDAWLAE